MRLLSGLVVSESSFWQQKLSGTVRSDALTAWTRANLVNVVNCCQVLVSQDVISSMSYTTYKLYKDFRGELNERKIDRERTRGGGFMDWSHVLSALQLSSQSRRHIKIRAAFETSAQMLIQTFSSLWITVLSDFDSLRTLFPCDKIFFLSASQSIHQHSVSTCPIHSAKSNGETAENDLREGDENQANLLWEDKKRKPLFYQ